MDGCHLLPGAAPSPRGWEASDLDTLLARATGCVAFGRNETLGVDVVIAGSVTRLALPDAAAAQRLRAAAARHGVPLTPSLGRLLSRAFGRLRPDALEASPSVDERPS